MVLAFRPGVRGSNPAPTSYFCHAFVHFFYTDFVRNKVRRIYREYSLGVVMYKKYLDNEVGRMGRIIIKPQLKLSIPEYSLICLYRSTLALFTFSVYLSL